MRLDPVPIETVVRNAVLKAGYFMLSGYCPERSTVSIISTFGSITRVAGLQDVQVLTPREQAEATPNVYSGNFGHDSFPLHTDLAHWFRPPRYFALRCVVGGKGVSTTLLDGRDLISGIGELALRRALVHPRRPVAGFRPLLRLLDQRTGELCLRWDSLFVRPATPISAETCAEVMRYLAASAPHEVTLLRPGDTLVVDNWRMLHGRSTIPPGSVDRRIERVYLGGLS